MSFFADASREVMQRNPDADDDGFTTFSEDPLELPKLQLTNPLASPPPVVILPADRTSSVFLSAVFATDAGCHLGTCGNCDIVQMALFGGDAGSVVLMLPRSDVPTELAASLPMTIVEGLKPQRVVVLGTQTIETSPFGSEVGHAFVVCSDVTPESHRLRSFPRLPPPHLVTGLAAGVVSAAQCCGVSCQAIVATVGLTVPGEAFACFLAGLEQVLGRDGLGDVESIQARLNAARKRLNQRGTRIAGTMFL